MAKVEGKRRCFSCKRHRWVARSGKRPNGSWWYLCRRCLDGFREERAADERHDREAIEMLQGRGDL